MAIPTFVSSSGTPNQITATVTLPGSIVAGNLLIIFWESDDGNVPTAAGWTSGMTPMTYHGTHKTGFLWKIATGAEGASIALTWTVGSFNEAFSVQYSGINPANPINVVANSAANTTDCIAPSVTTTLGNCLSVVACTYDGGSQNTAAPTGWTRRLNGNGTYNFYSAEKLELAAGATGTDDFTANGTITLNEQIAIRVALEPAGDSTPLQMLGNLGDPPWQWQQQFGVDPPVEAPVVEDRVTNRVAPVIEVPLSRLVPRVSTRGRSTLTPVIDDPTGVAVVAMVGYVPRALSAPTIIVRSLTPAQRTPVAAAPDRVENHATIIRAPFVAEPPSIQVRLLRTRLDTDQFQKPVARRITVIPSRPLAQPSRLVIGLLRNRLNTEKPVARRINLYPSRALSKPPTITTRALRQRLDTDQFQKPVARRINVIPSRAPIPAPRTFIARLPKPVVVAPSDRVVDRALIIAPRPPISAPHVTVQLLRTRLDTDRFQKPVARRITTITAPHALPAPRIATQLLRQRLSATVVVERWQNRALVVNVPQRLVKPTGVIVGGLLEGSAERIKNRVQVYRVPSTPFATRPPSYRQFVYAEPQADGGLTLVQLAVNVPRALSAPVTRISTPRPWLAVALVVERWRNRATTIPARPLSKPPRTTICLRRQRLDTDQFERRTKSRVVVRPPTPLRAPATFVHTPRPNTETRATGPLRVRSFRPALRPVAHAPIRLIARSPFRPSSSAPTFLAATGSASWAWEFAGDAIQFATVPNTVRNFVIGFDENVGRPKQTKGG